MMINRANGGAYVDFSSDRQVEDTQIVRFAKIHTNYYGVPCVYIYQKVFLI
jgi:hypothetical protein